MQEMQQQSPPQSPQAPNGGVNVEELAAKISSDLLALKEASPEAFEKLVAAIGAEGQSPDEGMAPQMAGPEGVPMSHNRG